MDDAECFFADIERLPSRGSNIVHRKRPAASDHRLMARFGAQSAPHDQVIEEITGMFSDDDIPLDAFDKQLLSEQSHDRQWQAEQGLARMSLPSKSSAPTHRSNTPAMFKDDLLDPYSQDHTSSSSPVGVRSSPTVSALQNRVSHSKRQGNNRMPPKSSMQPPPKATQIDLGHAIPIVQGIRLIPASELPDRLRSIFPHPIFNAVQSKCFSIAFKSNDNLVVSAPTGSGKTVIMELAICQLMATCKNGDFKIVYQAPTKSLCAERYRDWQAKFGALDLRCAELTGDTEYNQLHIVQSASILITTPEKWDSVTRKWKDNARLMEMVKLFLIDEVHILKDSRGATLEAVVSRMKSVGSDVRFVALSATIPNSHDIATWLGKSIQAQHLPAQREVFGEEFRPVQLQKIVQGYSFNANDYAFENLLNKEIPAVIAKHSLRKSIMVFCSTRASAIKLAGLLSQLWNTSNDDNKLWNGPRNRFRVINPDLQPMLSAGVAFHHAGLDPADRSAVEQGFLMGDIKIICSTSTLAVGVNLPCYLVIIKGTMGWSDHGLQEYPDLEVMQMLGRAGRPQFEKAACAVILTRQHKVQRYERMVCGEELLESCLHLNLIDHLNAEIGLGTVYDVSSAKRWLASTFLYVRIQRNPTYYQLKEDVQSNKEDELTERICEKDITLLRENKLVSKEGRLCSTVFGDAMARYYVKFDTMKIILSLPPKAKLSEILSALAQAAEFRDIRLKHGEKTLYKMFNDDNGIKFPVKVDIALPAHKVTLLIQTELSGTSYPATESLKKHRSQYQIDKKMVFSHINRLVRCTTDCQLHLKDSIATRHALELGRSLAARVWDNSSSLLKQIEGIGDVTIRKLASAGISSIETLENTEAHRIEMIMGRHPPTGSKILSKVAEFPKLRVSVKQTGQEREAGKCVTIRFGAEISFLNDSVPTFYGRRPIHVCFLAETSNGEVIDFRRFGARKLQNGHEILLSVQLIHPAACINCHVMCDEIAGTSRHAQLKLEQFPASWFPSAQIQHVVTNNDEMKVDYAIRRSGPKTSQTETESEDFSDGDLNDADLLAATFGGEKIDVVEDIDDLVRDSGAFAKHRRSSHKRTASQISMNDEEDEDAGIAVFREPLQLENGRWTCQHDCEEVGRRCKHKCCREGVARRRKAPKKKAKQDEEFGLVSIQIAKKATRKQKSPFETSTEVNEDRKQKQKSHGAQKAKALIQLHESTAPPKSTNVHSQEPDKPVRKASKRGLSFDENPDGLATDFRDDSWSELDHGDWPDANELFADNKTTLARGDLEYFEKENKDDYQAADVDWGAEWAATERFVLDPQDKIAGQTVTEWDDNSDEPALNGTDGLYPILTPEVISSDFFNGDVDLGRFEAPLAHVNLGDVKKRSRPAAGQSTSGSDKCHTTKRGLFITRESSSPCKTPHQARPGYSKTKVYDEVDGEEPTFLIIGLEQGLEADTHAPNAVRPLQEAANLGAQSIQPSTRQRTKAETSATFMGSKEGLEKKVREEEEKKRWEGIDPEFYKMLKDCVELV